MDEIESQDVVTEDEAEEDEDVQEDESEDGAEDKTTKGNEAKAKETPEQRKARLNRELSRLLKKHPELAEEGEKPKKDAKKSASAKPDGLDEAQLDFLDLKGVSDQDEINLIEQVVLKTGMTVREALKDEYVTSKLEKLRTDKEVKSATPSGTKRGAAKGDSLDALIDKFEKTGELPNDFALSTKIINAAVEKKSSNKPAWH
jgi:hypothetical protein